MLTSKGANGMIIREEDRKGVRDEEQDFEIRLKVNLYI